MMSKQDNIDYCYIIIDESKSNEQQMIAVSDTFDGAMNGTGLQHFNAITGKHENVALQRLRDSSHLYMGTFANNKMSLRQLKDNDGTKYLDGTTANMNGADGDLWLRINEEFYFFYTYQNGKDIFTLAVGGKPDINYKQHISPDDLLAVHEAVASNTGNNTTGILYSKSGSVSSGSISQANFKQKARNKGTGFRLVTWEWHGVMQLLFYAWYGRTNAQLQCGAGSNSYARTLGTKDSLGMTDTTSSNGNTDNTKFWGIENWWGDKYEWIDNVDVQNSRWTISYINGGVQSTNRQAITSNGWIKTEGNSATILMAPQSVGGSETTYYCDYLYINSGSRVLGRSGQKNETLGGVGTLSWYDDSTTAHAYVGSRLAYHGNIEVIG